MFVILCWHSSGKQGGVVAEGNCFVMLRLTLQIPRAVQLTSHGLGLQGNRHTTASFSGAGAGMPPCCRRRTHSPPCGPVALPRSLCPIRSRAELAFFSGARRTYVAVSEEVHTSLPISVSPAMNGFWPVWQAVAAQLVVCAPSGLGGITPWWLCVITVFRETLVGLQRC